MVRTQMITAKSEVAAPIPASLTLEGSKLIAERYVEYYAAQRNFRACIFSPFDRVRAAFGRNENGFVTHYVEAVKRGWPPRLPLGGRPVATFCYVDDFFARVPRLHRFLVTRGCIMLAAGARTQFIARND